MSPNNTFRIAAVMASLFVGLLSLPGCGSDQSSEPKSIATEARVQEIVEMRKIFDSAQGNWDSLSQADKDKYTEMAGGADKAKVMWDNMKNPGPRVGPPQ